MERGPFEHGYYTLTPPAKEPRKDHAVVWSYRNSTREEFHCDVFDGERYIGHLTFRLRGRKRRSRKGQG